MDRVKFYSLTDWAGAYFLPIAESIMRDFDAKKNTSDFDINDIIELFNIKAYIDAGASLKSWTDDDMIVFRTVVKEYSQLIGKYMNTVSDENVTDHYMSLDAGYHNDYWKLIEYYKLYTRISLDTFSALIDRCETEIYNVLKHEKLTKHYGAVLRNKLISYVLSAEILVDKYERSASDDKIFLPDELTVEDKESIINAYINSTNPNPNYLSLIIDNQQLGVSDYTRLKAKKCKEREIARLFDKKSGILMETLVSFSEEQGETIIDMSEGQRWAFSYSRKWLKQNSDYNTILNNFIYLFGFVDLQARVTLVSKYGEMGILERVSISRTNAYNVGLVYERKDLLAKLQLHSYYQELKLIGISLEDVIEWFFKCYLKDEFFVEDFRVQMPSSESLYVEKCRTVLPELESILKQFSLFIHYGVVDHELLQMSSNQLIYKEIPSLIKDKYVYGCGAEYARIKYHFFSDQSGLLYIRRIRDKYSSFFDLIMHEDVYLDDYLDYHKTDIKWLLDNSFIKIDSNGYIKPQDIKQLYILKDLNDNEVINYWSYSGGLKESIKELHKKGIVNFENSLFSRPEKDYFNYILNNSSFNNSLGLRNKYAHGTQPNGENENIHEDNYMTFLRLMILSIIKINDEFCIANSLDYKEAIR